VSEIPTGTIENTQNIVGLNRVVFYFPATEMKRIVVSLAQAEGSLAVTDVMIRGCFESGKAS